MEVLPHDEQIAEKGKPPAYSPTGGVRNARWRLDTEDHMLFLFCLMMLLLAAVMVVKLYDTRSEARPATTIKPAGPRPTVRS
jgi:hypothetical protein